MVKFLSSALPPLLMMALITNCSSLQAVPEGMSPGMAAERLTASLEEGLDGTVGLLERLRARVEELREIPPDVDLSKFDMAKLRAGLLGAWTSPVDAGRAADRMASPNQLPDGGPPPEFHLASVSTAEIQAEGYATGVGLEVEVYLKERLRLVREIRDQLMFLIPHRAEALLAQARTSHDEAQGLLEAAQEAAQAAQETGAGVERAQRDLQLTQSQMERIKTLQGRVEKELAGLDKQIEGVKGLVEAALGAVGQKE